MNAALTDNWPIPVTIMTSMTHDLPRPTLRAPKRWFPGWPDSVAAINAPSDLPADIRSRGPLTWCMRSWWTSPIEEDAE